MKNNEQERLASTISRKELTMMNAARDHKCRLMPHYVKIEVIECEGSSLIWFMTFNDDAEIEQQIPVWQCPWCPESLIDYSIVDLRGPHPPNKTGQLLCNGNCNWETCQEPRIICKECGYISCDSWKCGEQFDQAIMFLINLEDNGERFCRGCLCMNTEVYMTIGDKVQANYSSGFISNEKHDQIIDEGGYS